MKANLNIGQTGFTNIHKISRNIVAKNNNNVAIESSKTGRRDSIKISQQGKENSFLENLMKQKTYITKQKNSLISSTLENGGTLDEIKSQLENYEEQMKSVDGQIAEMMAKEMEKQSEKVQKQEDSKPKTEEEIQNERLASLTNLSLDLEQSQKISSVQARVEGNARVLKSEIELDKQRGGSSLGTREMITKKEMTLEAMQQKSLDLTSEIAEKLSDVADKVSDNNKPQDVLASEENEGKIEEETSK